MNKAEFIEQEVDKNKRAFGKWHSTRKRDSADEKKLHMGPSNEEEANQYGNALANTGGYPVGTSECFCVGISGNCGPDCFVYLKGECDVPDEMLPGISPEDLKIHEELYGEVEEKADA